MESDSSKTIPNAYISEGKNGNDQDERETAKFIKRHFHIILK